MTYVKIDGVLYPAQILEQRRNFNFDFRDTKTVTLETTHDIAINLFVDDIQWSIVEEVIEEGNTSYFEYDNSEYCLAGDVIDHRDGTISVIMGKMTDRELLNILIGGSNDH